MKQIVYGILACGLVAVLPAQGATTAEGLAGAGKASAAVSGNDVSETGPTVGSDPSLCLDSMETVPDDDDLVPMPAAMDGGCSVPEAPLAT
jgi:hypothetical protein